MFRRQGQQPMLGKPFVRPAVMGLPLPFPDTIQPPLQQTAQPSSHIAIHISERVRFAVLEIPIPAPQSPVHFRHDFLQATPVQPRRHRPHPFPQLQQASLLKLRERVRTMTSRLDGRSLKEIVTEVNRTLRGWYGYFQHSKPNTFRNVDGYVRRRLRSLLQWRLDGVGKGQGKAHHRWPNEWFAQHGLLSLAAEHAWTRTIVQLRTH